MNFRAPNTENRSGTQIQRPANPQSLNFLENILRHVTGGSRTAWGIGIRNMDNQYYILHQNRCIPLVYLRLAIQSPSGIRVTADEGTIDFQIALHQEPDTRKVHVALYKLGQEAEPLALSNAETLAGYLFAVGQASDQNGIAYGFFVTLNGEYGTVVGDSSLDLLDSWEQIVKLLEKGGNNVYGLA